MTYSPVKLFSKGWLIIDFQITPSFAHIFSEMFFCTTNFLWMHRSCSVMFNSSYTP